MLSLSFGLKDRNISIYDVVGGQLTAEFCYFKSEFALNDRVECRQAEMGNRWFPGTIAQLYPTYLVHMDGVIKDQLIVLDLFDEVRKLQPPV